MACEIMMNHSVEVVDGLYHQSAWAQPLSPELGSPVHAGSPHGSLYSPTSPVLSHAGSPPHMGCYSPVHSPPMHAVHSPPMHAVHSPHSIMTNSPSPLDHTIIKHEHITCDELGYARSDNSRSLSTLLRDSSQELSCVVQSCQFGGPREILDGNYHLNFCVFLHILWQVSMVILITWVCPRSALKPIGCACDRCVIQFKVCNIDNHHPVLDTCFDV